MEARGIEPLTTTRDITYYNKVEYEKRIYKIGDNVKLFAGEGNDSFLGAITKIYQEHGQDMALTIRWFYKWKDLPEEVELPKKIKTYDNELLYSFHEDDNSTESLETTFDVIYFNMSTSVNAVPDDVAFVRYLYDHEELRIVKLNKDAIAKFPGYKRTIKDLLKIADSQDQTILNNLLSKRKAPTASEQPKKKQKIITRSQKRSPAMTPSHVVSDTSEEELDFEAEKKKKNLKHTKRIEIAFAEDAKKKPLKKTKEVPKPKKVEPQPPKTKKAEPQLPKPKSPKKPTKKADTRSNEDKKSNERDKETKKAKYQEVTNPFLLVSKVDSPKLSDADTEDEVSDGDFKQKKTLKTSPKKSRFASLPDIGLTTEQKKELKLVIKKLTTDIFTEPTAWPFQPKELRDKALERARTETKSKYSDTEIIKRFRIRLNNLSKQVKPKEPQPAKTNNKTTTIPDDFDGPSPLLSPSNHFPNSRYSDNYPASQPNYQPNHPPDPRGGRGGPSMDPRRGPPIDPRGSLPMDPRGPPMDPRGGPPMDPRGGPPMDPRGMGGPPPGRSPAQDPRGRGGPPPGPPINYPPAGPQGGYNDPRAVQNNRPPSQIPNDPRGRYDEPPRNNNLEDPRRKSLNVNISVGAVNHREDPRTSRISEPKDKLIQYDQDDFMILNNSKTTLARKGDLRTSTALDSSWDLPQVDPLDVEPEPAYEELMGLLDIIKNRVDQPTATKSSNAPAPPPNELNQSGMRQTSQPIGGGYPQNSAYDPRGNENYYNSSQPPSGSWENRNNQQMPHSFSKPPQQPNYNNNKPNQPLNYNNPPPPNHPPHNNNNNNNNNNRRLEIQENECYEELKLFLKNVCDDGKPKQRLAQIDSGVVKWRNCSLFPNLIHFLEKSEAKGICVIDGDISAPDCTVCPPYHMLNSNAGDPATFNDFQLMRELVLTRDQIIRLHSAGNLEKSRGYWVRIGIKATPTVTSYALAQVFDVYEDEDSKKAVFTLQLPSVVKKERFSMEHVSNKKFLQIEYQRWKLTIGVEGSFDKSREVSRVRNKRKW